MWSRPVCAHPDAVPLMGVKAARDQAYAPACAIANEAAIALKAALQAERRDAPAVPAEAVSAAIAAKERELGGRPLTAGQKAMVTAVATSGRGVELVVGVAGSGKSTALDVARRAFEAAGYRVLGTAISGQAARTLGTEAGIDEPRTIASLLWRLDHGQLKLDDRTVVCCDEAGMADDPAMLRLLAATEAAGSKLVIVGDHRQIGAVGPGGSLEALVSRHRGGVHLLTENVRQADPDERAVLAELRAGEVDKAVNWYAQHAAGQGRAGPRGGARPDGRRLGKRRRRREGNGHAGLAAGERRRPQLPGPGGYGRGRPAVRTGAAAWAATSTRPGDRVVTLAPSAHGQLVTSQRGSVVRRRPRSRDAHGQHGRRDRPTPLAPEETSPDRLAHGYATTVHRSQGATFDTAHLFADGGGRELGYVA